jgi:uncharacterized protein (TIGR02466 family)
VPVVTVEGTALEVERTRRHALFPTFVWQTRLTDEATRELNVPMLARLDALRAGLPPLAPGRNFQSEQNLHEDPAFAGFMSLVRGALDGVLDFLKVEPREMLITGCWANVGAPGATHTPHTHPNNFLSGVYYLSAPTGGNRITFDDPRPHTFVLSPMVSEITLENSSFINVTVAEGCLLLFPAWLQHRVHENRSAVERVSVAFNAMFPGYAEMLAARA